MDANNFTFISLEKFGRVSFDLQNVGKNPMNKLASVSFCFMVGILVIIGNGNTDIPNLQS